jgi:uncharacterized phage infection (PIP) family protein YhgE
MSQMLKQLFLLFALTLATVGNNCYSQKKPDKDCSCSDKKDCETLKKCADNEARLEVLANDVETQKKTIIGLQADTAKLYKGVKDKNAEVSVLNSENKLLQMELDSAKSELNKYNSDLEALKLELETVKNTLAKFETDRDSVIKATVKKQDRSYIDGEINKLSDEANLLIVRTDFYSAREKVKQLLNEVSDMDKMLSSDCFSSGPSKADLDALHSKLLNYSQLVETMISANNFMKSRYDGSKKSSVLNSLNGALQLNNLTSTQKSEITKLIGLINGYCAKNDVCYGVLKFAHELAVDLQSESEAIKFISGKRVEFLEYEYLDKLLEKKKKTPTYDYTKDISMCAK